MGKEGIHDFKITKALVVTFAPEDLLRFHSTREKGGGLVK